MGTYTGVWPVALRTRRLYNNGSASSRLFIILWTLKPLPSSSLSLWPMNYLLLRSLWFYDFEKTSLALYSDFDIFFYSIRWISIIIPKNQAFTIFPYCRIILVAINSKLQQIPRLYRSDYTRNSPIARDPSWEGRPSYFLFLRFLTRDEDMSVLAYWHILYFVWIGRIRTKRNNSALQARK